MVHYSPCGLPYLPRVTRSATLALWLSYRRSRSLSALVVWTAFVPARSRSGGSREPQNGHHERRVSLAFSTPTASHISITVLARLLALSVSAWRASATVTHPPIRFSSGGGVTGTSARRDGPISLEQSSALWVVVPHPATVSNPTPTASLASVLFRIVCLSNKSSSAA